MCGIAGAFAYASHAIPSVPRLRQMGATIAHRGPDDVGYHVDERSRLGLVHRRLSIIDITSGHQPMADSDGRCWIVFNGEIYNFPELRRELEQAGRCFRTKSDTEVILNLYLQYGISALSRLNGIFAIAIYDGANRTLLLARDPFGVKPLYYHDRGGTLVFGSELKAILAYEARTPDVDVDALDTFLTYRFNPSPQTLFDGIFKLPPGTFLQVALDGTVQTAEYGVHTPPATVAISADEAVEEYDRLLRQAVRRQLLSDVPVGLFLSGGLDSAAIALCMQAVADRPIQTFSIGFEGRGDYNELADARRTAALIGTEHREALLTQDDYLDFFPKSFHFTEEPIAETTIPALWHVAHLAAADVKVVLAGQGADELLAGYRRYLGVRWLDPVAPVLRLAGPALQLLPRSHGLKRAAFAAAMPDRVSRLHALLTIFTPRQKARLFTPAAWARVDHCDADALRRLYTESAALPDMLRQALYIDTRFGLADDLLLFNDKMTMANSLEMRVPFLDRDLVRFVEALPASFKLRGRSRKYLHKRWATRYLPRDIVHRKKRGFATPMDDWLQSNLAPAARALLTARDAACREYFRPGTIDEMIRRHVARREDYRIHLFALLSFELWHRAFLGNAPIPERLADGA